jgi:D-psicose/D-tagatose/L-ribulose 3-epimerase
MKTGMNLLLWTTHVTAEHFPLFAELKKTGFDGIELPLFEGGADHYKTIAAELKKQGLGCTAVTVVGPEASPISPDANIRRAAVDRHKWAIEMTAVLGGENLCGPYHSPLGVFSGTGPTEDEKSRCCDVLRQSAEFAKQHKVNLAIEYLNRFECYFLTTAAQAKDLVQRVNHPSFRTMYDTFHANIEEKSPAAGIRTLAGTSFTSTSAKTTAARPAPAWSTGTTPSRPSKRSSTTAGSSSRRLGGRCRHWPRPPRCGVICSRLRRRSIPRDSS